MARRKRSKDTPKGITEREVEDVEELSTPRTPVIYEVVRRLGDEEMERPAISLWWSGVAAGLSISFSLLAQAILQSHLPDAPWRPLVSGFGYSVGFLMVVLGRQQLFTESTITAVLPVLKDLHGILAHGAAVGDRARRQYRRHAVRGAVLPLHAGAPARAARRHARDQPRPAGDRLVGHVLPRRLLGLPDRRHGVDDAERRRRQVRR